MFQYSRYWCPKSEEEAQWLIDTHNSGDKFWEWGKYYAETLVEFFPNNTSVVMDYGCGVGRVIGNINIPCCIGVDVSEEMLEMARTRYPQCCFVQLTNGSIPFGHNSIDFVFSLLVFQHMDPKDVRKALCEIGRIMRNGARCYLQFSAIGNKYDENVEYTRSVPNWTGSMSDSTFSGHVMTAYTADIIKKMAADAKIGVIDIIDSSDYYVLYGEK